MSNQIHISFNPNKFNLYINDFFEQVKIKLYYLQTDLTLKQIADKIAEHLMDIQKNVNGHSKEDISSEIWFMK